VSFLGFSIFFKTFSFKLQMIEIILWFQSLNPEVWQIVNFSFGADSIRILTSISKILLMKTQNAVLSRLVLFVAL
jgi:hypothetical protein